MNEGFPKFSSEVIKCYAHFCHQIWTCFRILGGALLKSVRDTFQNKVDGKDDSLLSEKILMYSAHDHTIMAITSLLDVFNHKIVPSAGAVIMELFSSSADNKFYVKFSYRNQSNQEPHVLKMKVCDYVEHCDWEVFYANTANLTLEDWDRECAMGDDDDDDDVKLVVFLKFSLCGTFAEFRHLS